jgi:predicted transposase/invertase (TIGR01784 family)
MTLFPYTTPSDLASLSVFPLRLKPRKKGNAIEGKNYPKGTAVTINTLEDALFMERINDVSFLLDERLIVLIEHQTTLSENFPLRMLLYIGRLYEKILENDNIYRQRLIKIPKPDFIVLYNGDAEYPDRAELRLSDAFKEADIPELLELTVRVYNINRGRNKEILQRSKSLGDYAAFIGRVKENRAKGLSAEEAVREAVEYCIGNGIMKEYLESNASEVKNMLLTEWNMDDAKRVWREEALEEGMEKGMERGLEQAAENIAVNLLRNGANPELTAKSTGLPLEKILRLSESITKN